MKINFDQEVADEGEDLYYLLTPDQRLANAKVELSKGGYEIKKVGDVFIVGEENQVSQKEVNKIVNFLKPIKDNDLKGLCESRVLEAVFSGLADHGYDTNYLDYDTSTHVLPFETHTVAGKRLENGKWMAFDPVSRSMIFSPFEQENTKKNKPIAETVLFCGGSEEQLIDMLNLFYGEVFSRIEISDTPYNRRMAARN